MQNLTAPSGTPNVSCSCNCTASQPRGPEISEVELVQMVVMVGVMGVLVVVIVCLINHYKTSSWSLTSRHRPDHNLQQDGCLWPSDCSSQHTASEVLYAPPVVRSSFLQRDGFSRFQPTYPYVHHQIDLPPTICLSDGEEPPPYQGPCTLQLRPPEQQMELNQESVRAPPNRTIYHSDLMDVGGGGTGGGGGPRPPSSNSGISAANMEGPPPAYSEVVGHSPGSAFFLHQHSNNQRGEGGGGAIQQQNQSESTIVPAKVKDSQPQGLL